MGELSQFRQTLITGLADLGLSLDPMAIDKLLFFGEAVLAENKHQNLTRITEPTAVISRHLIDSLAVLQWLTLFKGRLCDIGTGAGFPGGPLAIAQPEYQVTLVDSEGKKVSFLKRTIEAMGLPNVATAHLRAEEAGREAQLRESFDIVVSRSVARLAVLSEYTLPLLRVGGTFWAFKGDTARSEVDQAKAAIKILGGEFTDFRDYLLPTGEAHTLIQITKTRGTPR